MLDSITLPHVEKMQVPHDFDVWEETPISRRKARRYRARWKVGLVFDNSPGKPIFQTLTHDLSLTGTSVQSNTDEPVHTVLTLLLLPPRVDGAPQRMIKLESVVMSSMPFRGGFRLGMRFLENPELDKLKASFEKFDLSGDSLPSDPQGEKLPSLF